MKAFEKYLINDVQSVREALVALNNLSNDIQTLFVVSADGVVRGTVTDGDIRRGLITGITIHDPVTSVMNTQFRSITDTHNSVAYIRELKQLQIELLPQINEEGKLTRIHNLKSLKSLLPIDAVLMAGGKGVRLRPLTEQTPKPLLKLGDKAIIDHNVDRLIDYGVRHISATVNYLGEQLVEHFREPRRGVAVQCVKEPCFLGTMGSVKYIDNFANDTVLVMNSDLFTNIDYEDFYLHFEENNADLSVAAIPYSVSVPYGIFELEERNIVGVKEKPVYNYYANAGIYLIRRKLLDLIPQGTYFDATDFITKLVAEKYNVIRFPLIGYWIDIGKQEDYLKAQEFVRHTV